ncbi:hypothetical protein TTY48_11070 [Tsukamurella sp. TY48]|nr:hypothetical protein TTY48_11070 [Tsukamurella sp. TY48]
MRMETFGDRENFERSERVQNFDLVEYQDAESHPATLLPSRDVVQIAAVPRLLLPLWLRKVGSVRRGLVLDDDHVYGVNMQMFTP